MSLSFTDGIVVFIESDKAGEWWLAKTWQKTNFMKAMQFGTMKSMGGYIATETTKPFNNGPYTYSFIIEEGWGPIYLENQTTGKKREVRYHHLQKTQKAFCDMTEEEKNEFRKRGNNKDEYSLSVIRNSK